MREGLENIFYGLILSNDLTESKSKFDSSLETEGLEKTLDALNGALQRYFPDSWFSRNVWFLSIFEKEHLSGISIDILDKVAELGNLQSYDAFEEVLSVFLYGIAEEQLHKGFSTLFYNFQQFDEEYRELAQFGLLMRKAEFLNVLENLPASFQDQPEDMQVDLMDIWHTHHGFDVLIHLGVSRYSEKSEIKMIMTALETCRNEISAKQVDELKIDTMSNEYVLKRELVHGMTKLLGGHALNVKRNMSWEPPDHVHTQDTVTALELVGGLISENTLLDILGAVWLFPKNSEEVWQIRHRILQRYDSMIDTDVFERILRFLNTLDCSDLISTKAAKTCLSSALQVCIRKDKNLVYSTLIKMLRCLSFNTDSARGHTAIEALREIYIDRIIGDLLGGSDLNSWLQRNREVLHIDDFRNLVLDAYQSDTRKDPTHFTRWISVLQHFEKIGMNKVILECRQHMVQIQPDDMGHLNDYGTELALIGRYAEASDIFEKLLEKYPDNSQYLNNLAFTVYMSGDCKNALKISQGIIERPDADYHTWHTYGAVLHCLKNYDEAEKAYRKSIEINREHFDAWDDLIRLLEDMKRSEEAEETRKTYKGVRSRSLVGMMDRIS